MTTEPNKKLLDDPNTLTIDLEGVKWPVPKLAPKQNEIVVPLILRTVPRIMRSIKVVPPAEGEVIDPTKPRKTQMDLALLADALTEQGMRDLGTIVFWALERGHPTLTKDEFENMPIGTLDMIEAVMVISKQTGVIRQGSSPVGEAQAAA